MFKKLLSTFTLMMLLCTLGASAQNVQTKRIDARVMPTPATSVITPENDEFWWGYWDGVVDENIRLLGVGQHTQIPQQYSACIRIPAGSAIGKDKTIEGIRFSISDTKNIDDFKIWLSNELPVTADKSSICCENIAKENLTSMMAQGGDQWNEIRFTKPYKILDNKDVYIGYSFKVIANDDQNDQYPLIVDMANPTQENAMYLKFTEPSEWTDFKGAQNGDLALQVLMSGDIQRGSVGITPSFDPIYGAKNKQVTIPVTFDNRGTDGFQELDLIIDINGNKENVKFKAAYPVKGMNETYKYDLELNTLAEPGTSDVTVTIDKVDGKVNECKDNVMKGKIITLTREGKKKVLVEEFTALWCGACPAGYVGLQKLRQQFGKDIVLVSLHRSDPLECTDYVDFILGTNNVGYPNSHLDRTYMDIYPYAGSGKNGKEGKVAGFGGFGLGNDCRKLMEVLPVAEIDVTADIEGDVLTATATTKFLYSGDTDHALAFVITEDGVHSEDWLQSNYLTDQKGWGWENEEPLFDMWVNGDKKIANVIYDDIAVAAQDVYYGIDGSIPATVKEEEALTYTTKFNLDEYINIQDRNNLNIIAFIIDKTTGRIVNADYKKVGETSGINNVGEENDVNEVARYTLDGRRISAAEKGINIIKYSDGSVKKVVIE